MAFFTAPRRTRPFAKTLAAASLLAAVGAILSACTGPQLLNAVSRNPDRSTQIVRDIAYGSGPRQVLDLYIPDGAGPHPMLVFVYGGSWTRGSRQEYAFAGKRFAAEGYVTAVIDYSLGPDRPYPSFVEDTVLATAWLHKEGPARGGDANRLFLTGHSAGAYNVVMAAMRRDLLDAAGLPQGAITGVAGLSGPYDFLPITIPDVLAAFGPYATDPSTQPVNVVRDAPPPMLLINGTADTVVYPRNAISMAAHLETLGGEAIVKEYEGADHADPLIAISFQDRAPTVEDLTTFFENAAAAR